MRYTQILKYTTPHRRTLALIVLLLLAVTAANLANSLIDGAVTGALLDEPGSTALSLLATDAESISRFVTNTVVQLLPQLVTLAFAFLAMAWIDPLVAGLAVLLLPVYTIVTKLIGRRIRPLSRAFRLYAILRHKGPSDLWERLQPQ